MPPKAKKKPNPRLKRPEDRAQIVSTSVPPDLRDWLVRFGGGKLTAGLRQAAVEARENHGEKFSGKS